MTGPDRPFRFPRLPGRVKGLLLILFLVVVSVIGAIGLNQQPQTTPPPGASTTVTGP